MVWTMKQLAALTFLCSLAGLAAFTLKLPAASAATATVTKFDAPAGYVINDLVSGPEGSIWFTAETPLPGDQTSGAKVAVGRMTPSGEATLFELAPKTCESGSGRIYDVTPGAIGASAGEVWFARSPHPVGGTCTEAREINRMDPNGTINLTVKLSRSPGPVVVASDGNVYILGADLFGLAPLSEIHRVTPAGEVIRLVTSWKPMLGLVEGRDGAIWAGLGGLGDAEDEPEQYAAYRGREFVRVARDGTVTLGDAPHNGPTTVVDRGPNGTFWYLRAPCVPGATACPDPPAPRLLAGRFGSNPREYGLSDRGFSADQSAATGSDGNLWITNPGRRPSSDFDTVERSLVRLTPSGEISDYTSLLPRDRWACEKIVRGPDGALWIAATHEDSGQQLVRVTPGDPPLAPSNRRVGPPEPRFLDVRPARFRAARRRGRGARIVYQLTATGSARMRFYEIGTGRRPKLVGLITRDYLAPRRREFKFGGWVLTQNRRTSLFVWRKLRPGRYFVELRGHRLQAGGRLSAERRRVKFTVLP